jgi:predicted transcriptional regulator
MDDKIEIELRLPDELARNLAQFAVDVGQTMDEIVERALALNVGAWEARRRGSRNGREGRYVGKHQGRHLRTSKMMRHWSSMPDADFAWGVASLRAGEPLPLRRPRYIAKGQRDG